MECCAVYIQCSCLDEGENAMRKNSILRAFAGGGKGIVFALACTLLLASCSGGENASTISPAPESGVQSSASTTFTGSTNEITAGSGVTEGLTSNTEAISTAATRTEPTNKPENTTKTTNKSTTTTTKKGSSSALSKLKTSDIGFGYYGLYPDSLELDTSGTAMIQSDYVNTIIAGADSYTLKLCKEHNTRVWCSVYSIYEKAANGVLGWQDDFDQLVKEAKATGAYDALLGWYLDEPIDQDAVKAISQYAQKYGKRFFVCYTVSTVAPQIYSDGVREPVTADQAQYLTDIAFDMYWGDQARFQAVLDSMKKRVARDDVYIWFIPGCYGDKSLASDPAAAAAEVGKWVDQLNMLYGMLRDEKKPGGLMCFVYKFDSSVENLYGLKEINRGTNGAWNDILAEQIRIGREICTGKMK